MAILRGATASLVVPWAALVLSGSGPAQAEVATIYKGPVWDTAVDQQQFFGIIGHSQALTPAGMVKREFAFYLSTRDRKFGILAEKENLRLPRGAIVPVVVAFWSMQTFRFNAR